MNKLQETLLAIRQKQQAVSAIFGSKNDVAEMTEAEITTVKSLNEEIGNMQAEAKRLEELEAMKASSTDFAEAAYKHHATTGSNAPAVLGSTFEGDTVIEKKNGGLSVAYEEGWSLDKKTHAAINSKEYKQAFRKYLRNGHGVQGLVSSEIKALQEGVDSQGGFLVPDDMLNRLIDRKPTPTSVAGLVTRLQTSRDALTIPKVNYTDTNNNNVYTTGIRVTKTGEIPSSSTVHRVTEPTFGQTRIPVHTYMMSMPLTNDMIEDSAFPLMEWSANKFRETIDLLYDNEIINGNGIGGPLGILDASVIGTGANQIASVVTGSAAALTADGVIDLAYSVPPQYRSELRYLMSYLNAAKALAKLKDGQNQYLFKMGGTAAQAGLQGAFPDTLNGLPIVYSEFMPTIAANAYPIIFGAFSGYYLVERVGFSVQVLSELYAETNQQLLLGRLRFGGQPAEPWKLKVQKCST